MKIKIIDDYYDKQNIAREILESLPEWFGITDTRENYIRESKDQIFFAAFEEHQVKGFLCLKPTSKDTLEISVIGVFKHFHRQGIGKQLFLKG